MKYNSNQQGEIISSRDGYEDKFNICAGSEKQGISEYIETG